MRQCSQAVGDLARWIRQQQEGESPSITSLIDQGEIMVCHTMHLIVDVLVGGERLDDASHRHASCQEHHNLAETLINDVHRMRQIVIDHYANELVDQEKCTMQ